jgi:signal transduction histidine kinase
MSTATQWRHRVPKVRVGHQLSLFYAVAALALIVVSIGAVVASRSVARQQALQDAERTTVRLADRIGPLLDKALSGDERSRQDLDLAVSYRMGGDYLTEINVWDASGNVVYADDPEEIGKHLAPPQQVVDVVNSGTPTSDFTTQPHASQQTFGPDDPGFVEVYVPFDLPQLRTLAFEAYYNYTPVDEVANELLWKLIPLVLVPLVVLQLFQVPLTSSMARRVRRHEADRAALLERTLSVSERERIRIAGDLHDGPVQNLAGVGYALDSVASSVPEQYAILMRRIQDTVHDVIWSLRKLMVDLYPPDLSVEQLSAIIASLAAPLADQGITVTTTTPTLPELDGETVTALYRVARESLANVVEHANAHKVDISFGFDEADGPARASTVLLRIIDDGVGVDPGKVDKRAEGHLGLRLLKDRVENLGGTLTVRAGPHGGTTVLAELPVDPDSATAAGRGNTGRHRSRRRRRVPPPASTQDALSH